MLSYTHFLASNNTPAQLLHSGCRYGVTFYDLVISVFMAGGGLQMVSVNLSD